MLRSWAWEQGASLSPNERLCQTGRISVKVFLRHHMHKTGMDLRLDGRTHRGATWLTMQKHFCGHGYHPYGDINTISLLFMCEKNAWMVTSHLLVILSVKSQAVQSVSSSHAYIRLGLLLDKLRGLQSSKQGRYQRKEYFQINVYLQ